MVELVLLQLQNKDSHAQVGNRSHNVTGTLLPILMLTDNMLIMSTSAAGLQQQPDALQNFCSCKKLTVSTAKAKIVVFEPQYTGRRDFTYNGNVLQRVCKYLWLSIAAHLGVAWAPEERCAQCDQQTSVSTD